MPQGVFRLRSAVLSAHLTCLSILQTVLPPAALSRFRGTGHSDRIQTLRALPSPLCAFNHAGNSRADSSPFTRNPVSPGRAVYENPPKSDGNTSIFRRDAHSGWNLDAFLPALPPPRRIPPRNAASLQCVCAIKETRKSPKNSALREIKCTRRHRKIFLN